MVRSLLVPNLETHLPLLYHPTQPVLFDKNGVVDGEGSEFVSAHEGGVFVVESPTGFGVGLDLSDFFDVFFEDEGVFGIIAVLEEVEKCIDG